MIFGRYNLHAINQKSRCEPNPSSRLCSISSAKFEKSTVYYLTFLAFAFVLNLGAVGGELLIDPDHRRGGWQGFGTGLDDAGFDKGKNEIVLQVNWARASWGVGVMHTLENPVDGRAIYAIRVKVKSRKGSKTKIYAGLATKEDATMELPREKSIAVTDQWQIIEFPISEMIFKKPELTSQKFGPDDWEKLQIVKLLFTRQNNNDSKDTIYIAKPKIVYSK